MWEKKTKIAKTLVKKEQSMGIAHCKQIYYTSIIINTIKYWCSDRQIDKETEEERRPRNRSMYTKINICGDIINK